MCPGKLAWREGVGRAAEKPCLQPCNPSSVCAASPRAVPYGTARRARPALRRPGQGERRGRGSVSVPGAVASAAVGGWLSPVAAGKV